MIKKIVLMGENFEGKKPFLIQFKVENQLNPFLVFDFSLPIKLHASVPVLSNKVLFGESESPF